MLTEPFLDRFHGNERLVGLSDGVFAIVLTLLVLELRVPQPHRLVRLHLGSDRASDLQHWFAGVS